MKKTIIAANWKLNKSPNETRSFFQTFLENLKSQSKITSQLASTLDIVFFPPTISIEAASQSVKGSPIKFGAQNIYFESQGAFTGENSAKVVKELSGEYALIGHSERRQYFQETSSELGKKVQHALQMNLIPMYCVGETLAERDAVKTESVLLAQLNEALNVVNLPLESLVVAYEPVWAIGTGKIATADQVQDTHAFIRKTLSSRGLGNVPILYGGSVKASSAAELIRIPNVSGFLVGGASLEASSFLDLISNSL